MKDVFDVLGMLLIMLLGAIAVVGTVIGALIVDNFKWLLVCGTALLIASWYL